MEHSEIQDDEKSVFDKPVMVRLIWIVLIGGSAISAILGFVLTAQHKMGHHPHFKDKEGFLGTLGQIADHFPVFYGVLGFLAFSFIVLAGQHLRGILMRDENYYKDEPESGGADQ